VQRQVHVLQPRVAHRAGRPCEATLHSDRLVRVNGQYSSADEIQNFPGLQGHKLSTLSIESVVAVEDTAVVLGTQYRPEFLYGLPLPVDGRHRELGKRTQAHLGVRRLPGVPREKTTDNDGTISGDKAFGVSVYFVEK
jgi:hypothetical protein